MPVLGELEQAVMEVLWGSPTALSVRDVQAALADDRELAYTTVMTVLDNLHRKGYVERVMRGRAYQYRPAFTRSRASAEAMREIPELRHPVKTTLRPRDVLEPAIAYARHGHYVMPGKISGRSCFVRCAETITVAAMQMHVKQRRIRQRWLAKTV